MPLLALGCDVGARYVGWAVLDDTLLAHGVWDLQEAYWIGNLFVTLASADEKWALRGYVKNVGDEDYVVSQFANAAPLGNSATFGNYGPPRTIGIELSARFN